jgi:hypothetical protein
MTPMGGIFRSAFTQSGAKLSERVSHRAEHRDSVCGTRGRRYFHVGRRLSWRCRR